MRAILTSLAAVLLSAVLLVPGCDRLPARGGEGEACFGNGTCDADLICEEGVCVEACIPSCADKGCGESDGCEGTCSACPSGYWCDGTSCQPCDTAEHCGDSCTGCTADPRGDACVDMGGFQCGCQSDLNCGDNQYCDLVSQTCGACQPDCGVRVCGADGCGGQCPPGCNVGTETCNADGQCESCSNDCTGLTCGSRNGCGLECDGLGVECAAGMFCESDGACVACDLSDHCGDLCADCTGDASGHQCITSDVPHHCGCIDTSDCPDGRACRAGLCEVCVPVCDGKCDGADDTCDRTCDAACPSGQCCQDQQCLANDHAQHCGPGLSCVDCSIADSNSDCVNLGGSTFVCGCNGNEDCDAGETCVGTQCQAAGEPVPTYSLDIPNCPVTALSLTGVHAGHQWPALLVGCDMDPEERVFLLDQTVAGASPDYTFGDLNSGPLSAHFQPGSYSIMVTDASGNWLFREQFGSSWIDAQPIGGELDGGMDDGGGGGGATQAVWSADGTRLMAARDMGMPGDWRMASGQINAGQLDGVEFLGAYGPFSGLAFLADGSVGVAVFSSAYMASMAWFDVQDPAGTEQSSMTNAEYRALAVPQASGSLEQMATISGESGQTKVRIWTNVDTLAPSSRFSFDLDAHSIAFLPEDAAATARHLLIGSIEGDLRVYRMVIPDPGLKPDALLVDGCGGTPISVMALSPDGTLLATACGGKVQVWDTAALRTYCESL